MQTVQITRALLEGIPFFGWWGSSTLALTGAVLFWDILSLLVIVAQKKIEGSYFTDLHRKWMFMIGVGGTAGIQFLIYISVGICTFSNCTLQDPAYPFIYFLTLALILISAIYFFALLISFIVGRLKPRKT